MPGYSLMVNLYREWQQLQHELVGKWFCLHLCFQELIMKDWSSICNHNSECSHDICHALASTLVAVMVVLRCKARSSHTFWSQRLLVSILVVPPRLSLACAGSTIAINININMGRRREHQRAINRQSICNI